MPRQRLRFYAFLSLEAQRKGMVIIMKVNNVLTYLSDKAPLNLKMDFDNVGLLVGDPDEEVTKILIALDITSEVIDEAISMGANLIVSHHPVIWDPMKSLVSTNMQQKKVIKLVQNGISAICMHTNLDIVQDGVNDVLMELLDAKTIKVLEETGEDQGCGRIGLLTDECDLHSFLYKCKTVLHTKGIRYYDAHRPVKKIAVMGGSGGNEIELVSANECDTYITSDIKYDQFLLAKELGINIIDADHFYTENPVTQRLYEWLKDEYKENIFISSIQDAVAEFYV